MGRDARARPMQNRKLQTTPSSKLQKSQNLAKNLQKTVFLPPEWVFSTENPFFPPKMAKKCCENREKAFTEPNFAMGKRTLANAFRHSAEAISNLANAIFQIAKGNRDFPTAKAKLSTAKTKFPVIKTKLSNGKNRIPKADFCRLGASLYCSVFFWLRGWIRDYEGHGISFDGLCDTGSLGLRHQPGSGV